MPKDLDFDPMIDQTYQFCKDPTSEGYILKSRLLDQELPPEEFRLVAFLEKPSEQFDENVIEPAGLESLQRISDQIVDELSEEERDKVANYDFENLDLDYDKVLILKIAAHLGDKWNTFYSKNSRMESMFFEEIDTLLGLSMQFGKLIGSFNTSKEREFFYKKGIRYHKLNSRQSEAGKYNKNRYYDDVMNVAALTWHRYPEASVASLSNKVFDYLQHRYPNKNDLPSKVTIEKTWLYNADFRPNIRSKRKLDFEIVKE
ncbi:hypothetical protein AB4374_13905 [Vibrio splendidus]